MSQPDFEEEVRILNMARRIGLDAPNISYAEWRKKILTLAQQLKEHNESTIRQDTDN